MTWQLDSAMTTESYGFINLDETYRTIMAYNRYCSDNDYRCGQIYYFSSPSLTTSDGFPVGNNETDNTGSLGGFYQEVSNYRGSVVSQHTAINITGDFNDWDPAAANGLLTYAGNFNWEGSVALKRGTNLVKITADGAWDKAWGADEFVKPLPDGTDEREVAEIEILIANTNYYVGTEVGKNEFRIKSNECGNYKVRFNELSGVLRISLNEIVDTEICQTPADVPTDYRRTVVFIYGETEPGQDMFVRGGIDHGYANDVLGRTCAGPGETATVLNSAECAISITHNNMLNETTANWKTSEKYLDWYGRESMQGRDYFDNPYPQVIAGVNLDDIQGTPLDWSTDVWPAGWGDKKEMSLHGFGETPLNLWGPHYWMLDVQMDCSEAVPDDNGNFWFELKSFISNGPGWEADVSQAGAPYVSGNHFGQCGKINMFRRGSPDFEIMDFQ
jgi:hypothetical protein